jgi:hypothetical protein
MQGPVLYLRYVDDGTNRTCYMSSDGVNFISQGSSSVSRTDFLTPTKMGIHVKQQSTVGSYDVGAWFFHYSVTTP